MDTTEKKKQLRALIRERKKSLGDAAMKAASARIFEKVEALPEFRKAENILAYWSFKGEVFTHDFVQKWYREKRIILPVVVGDELELRRFTGMECMVEGSSFGIMEPHKGPLAGVEEIDLALIPGVAFDPFGNRMGRGKAFYDKLLTSADFYKTGICFQLQVVEKIPVEPHDIPMDRIIHE